MHMLADAHAPQNHRPLGLGKGARHFAQGLGGNAADGSHRLGAAGFDLLAQGGVVVNPAANELLVCQSLFDDDVNQRIEHGDIGVGLELQGAPGVSAQVGDARVGQHDFGPPFGGVFDPGGGYRVVGAGVGTDDEDQF